MRASQDVTDVRLYPEFPLLVFQTGPGTQSNMNASDVTSNRAILRTGGVHRSLTPVHRNDDVSHGPESNDTFQTAIHIAAVEEISQRLLPSVRRLRSTLDVKARAYQKIFMVGRTHLRKQRPWRFGSYCPAGWRRSTTLWRPSSARPDGWSWRSVAPPSAPGPYARLPLAEAVRARSRRILERTSSPPAQVRGAFGEGDASSARVRLKVRQRGHRPTGLLQVGAEYGN